MKKTDDSSSLSDTKHLAKESECTECSAPAPLPWSDCPNCMKWFIPIVLKRSSVERKELQQQVQIEMTEEISLCLKGRQQGRLLFTTSLLPSEEMKIYHYDRYRQVTSAQARVSVHTSFRQSVSALWQARTTSDSSSYTKALVATRGESDASFSLFGFDFGSKGSIDASVDRESSQRVTANLFHQVATSASYAVEAERSLVISNYEDKDHIDATTRLLKNKNECYAVNYYVRRINEVYELSIRVASIRVRLVDGKYQSPWKDILEVEKGLGKTLEGLPKVGEVIKDFPCIVLPTDGTIVEAEQAHCCSCDPLREATLRVEIERIKNDAAKVKAEAELLEMEVRRRKALIEKGDLTPFEPAPVVLD